MKSVFLSILFLAGLALSLQAQEIPDDVPVFKIKSLSKAEKATFRAFRKAKGNKRKHLIGRVAHLLPSAPMIVVGNSMQLDLENLPMKMSEEDLIKLMGKPDSIRDGIWDYNLSPDSECEISIFMGEGCVLGAGYAGCTDEDDPSKVRLKKVD